MAKCAKCGQSAAWNAPMGLCDNCQRERQQLAQQRLEVHATRGANPGLIAVDPEDRILDNAWTLLISSGIETGVRAQTGTVTLALRNDALEVWGTDDLGNFEAIRLLRDEIIEIEIGGGEFVTSGGGVIGGGIRAGRCGYRDGRGLDHQRADYPHIAEPDCTDRYDQSRAGGADIDQPRGTGLQGAAGAGVRRCRAQHVRFPCAPLGVRCLTFRS